MWTLAYLHVCAERFTSLPLPSAFTSGAAFVPHRQMSHHRCRNSQYTQSPHLYTLLTCAVKQHPDANPARHSRSALGSLYSSNRTLRAPSSGAQITCITHHGQPREHIGCHFPTMGELQQHRNGACLRAKRTTPLLPRSRKPCDSLGRSRTDHTATKHIRHGV